MFGEDPFEDIIQEFFGPNARARTRSSGNVIKSEKEERVIDYIDEEEFVYFVFELPGYSREDVDVEVKGRELRISVLKENPEKAQPYLKAKLQKGIYFSKEIPDKVKPKTFEWHFNNGILEVRFKKK